MIVVEILHGYDRGETKVLHQYNVVEWIQPTFRGAN